MKAIHIFGGGTIAHIANHFAIAAPAYGNTARRLSELLLLDQRFENYKTYLELTRMAGGHIETNEEIAHKIDLIVDNPQSKIIFFSCALVDWKPTDLQEYKNRGGDKATYKLITSTFGKHEDRLETRKHQSLTLDLEPAEKIISRIRKTRKDIFLVGFKTTCGASKQEMYKKGLRLCKEGSANLVLVNDTKTHWNMIITPEEASYHETGDRNEVLRQLVDMVWYRSQLTFTQSTVVDGKPVSWDDPRIPDNLRTVINYCIEKGAYKEFGGSTVGHFGVSLSDTEFLTSIRKTNFNDLSRIGLVKIRTDGPDTIIAYGSKPSVGGQSQRIVFNTHKGYDCVFHAHIPLKEAHPDDIPIISQREAECGSHECGLRTASNLKEFLGGKIKAVMLDKHGPNIIFNSGTDPQVVIDFIENNFDISKKTGGYQF